MGPIDYTSAFANVPNPLQSFTDSFKYGTGIRQAGLEQEQAALKLEQQRQMQADLQALSASPTPQAIAQASIKYPQLSEQFKRSFDMLTTEQQQSKLSATLPVYAAIRSGRYDIAAKTLNETADVMEASGQTEEAQRTRAMASMIEQHPETAALTTGLLLSSVMGPDKFATAFGAIGSEQRAADKAPAELRQAEANAATAEVTAANAGTAAELANEDKASQIKARQNDAQIKREELRIKTMEGVLSRETNDLKKQELQLKIDEAKATLAEKQAAKGADAQGRMSDLQGSLDLLGSILGDEDTLRASTGTSAWRGALPGTKARTMAGKIEQLQNSIAAVNLDKLKGAMSDKDILFLKNIGSNLDRYQDEEQFIAELDRIKGAMERAQATLVAGGKLPTDGGAFVMKHPTYGNVSEGDVNALLSKNPGSTREQVLQFLRSTGGK